MTLVICIVVFGSLEISMARKSGYSKISSVESEEKPKEVSCLSALLFQWMNRVFKTGSERPLDQDDFLPLSEENSARSSTDKLQESWKKERDKCKKKGKRPKLWKSVLSMLTVNDLLVIVFGNVLYAAYHILSPLFLGYLVSKLISATTQENFPLYVCALSLCFIAVVGTFGIHHMGYRTELYGIRVSSALRGSVYRKVSTNL